MDAQIEVDQFIRQAKARVQLADRIDRFAQLKQLYGFYDKKVAQILFRVFFGNRPRKTAKMILTNFTEVSKGTAYALLKLAAKRPK